MGIILASQSPRRIELLKEIVPEFQAIPCTEKEVVPDGLTVHEVVMFLAKQKAETVSKIHPRNIVIGADTVVSIDNEILGKPKNQEDCCRMLKKLSGRTHCVYTGVAFTGIGKTEIFFEKTEVEFYPLTEKDINWYSLTNEPYDKAGSYGIQGKGALLVRGIIGDYFNVMGFPIASIWRRFKNYQIK